MHYFTIHNSIYITTIHTTQIYIHTKTHILLHHTHMIGVTGNGHDSEIAFFKSAGADRVLIKPLSADKFYDILCGE